MDKTNLELFKQALNEAVSNQFDKLAEGCDEVIVCSENHRLAMRTIVYGKSEKKRSLSSKTRRIIAILVAAALLLTSCAIIFRDEIREVFRELYVSLRYDGDEQPPTIINEVYSLGYVPEGYALNSEQISSLSVRYEFYNQENFIYFEQSVLAYSKICIDSERGYSQIDTINGQKIYHRRVDDIHYYVWDEDVYLLMMGSSVKLSDEELGLIIEGLILK